MTTITGVVAIWAASRTEAHELQQRGRAGVFRGCRLSWSSFEQIEPVLWTPSGQYIGPQDLPALTLFVRISALRWAPHAMLIERARAAGYTVRTVLELPKLREPRNRRRSPRPSVGA